MWKHDEVKKEIDLEERELKIINRIERISLNNVANSKLFDDLRCDSLSCPSLSATFLLKSIFYDRSN